MASWVDHRASILDPFEFRALDPPEAAAKDYVGGDCSLCPCQRSALEECRGEEGAPLVARGERVATIKLLLCLEN